MIEQLNVYILLTEGDELLVRYHTIWNKLSNATKKNLITNPSTIKNF